MRSRLILVSSLSFALLLKAQTTESPLQVGKDVRPPRLVHQVDPKYPRPKFFGKAKESVVIVGLVVDAKGFPQNVLVKTSGGDKFDQAALNAVKQYRFAPAEKNGTPVAVVLNIEVNFKIY